MLEEEQGKDGPMWTLEIVVLLKQSQVQHNIITVFNINIKFCWITQTYISLISLPFTQPEEGYLKNRLSKKRQISFY